MQTINIEKWPRRNLFRFYGGLDYPHFSVCADVDISRLHRQCRQSNISRFNGVLYGVSRAANSIEEFRLRIRGDQVILHDIVHPSFTVLTGEHVFCFCETKYCEDVNEFSDRTNEAITNAKENPSLDDKPGRDDYLFVSSLPWLKFSSVVHPIHMHPVDSIPRITWGKFTETHKRVVMPLSVQVHHGLADGYHVGQFFELFQQWVDSFELEKLDKLTADEEDPEN